MAILRNKTQKGYTIINYEIFRDVNLSLKERGMLCTLLSLPDSWHFSIAGLSKILTDGQSAIQNSLNKLENLGYLKRRKIKNEKGHFCDVEWEIYDTPKVCENSLPDKAVLPLSDNPYTDTPHVEMQQQYNINRYNIKDISIYQSKDNIDSEYAQQNEVTKISKIDKINVLACIKNNIEYEEIKRDNEYSIDAVDNIIELICSVVISEKKSFVVGKESINADTVKNSLMALERKHIEYVIDCVSSYKGVIKNINAYLLAALYNARNTVDIYWQQKLNREIPILVSELEKRKIHELESNNFKKNSFSDFLNPE